MTIQLVIGDPDTAYMASVSAYIRASNEGSKFEVKLFSQESRLQEYLEKQPPFDIILISSQWQPSLLTNIQSGLAVILDENRVLEEQTDSPAVFKYQPLNQLLSKILAIHYERNERITVNGLETDRTKVISVYSASGGAGKTTFAVNLCRQMALSEQKVFYLNLELLHSTPLFFTSSEEHPSSRILYYLKANPDQLVSKIESLKCYDPYTRVDYFDFPANAKEMLDLSEKDTEFLISGLARTGFYDSIIVDLDSSVEERVKAAIQTSDRVFWLLNSDLPSFHKTSVLLEASDSILGEGREMKNKTTFILNKHTGRSPDEFSDSDIPVQHYLPYIPEWKNARQGTEILTSPVFSKEIIPLMEANQERLRGASLD